MWTSICALSTVWLTAPSFMTFSQSMALHQNIPYGILSKSEHCRRGEEGRRYKLLGLDWSTWETWPYYVAYVFVFLCSITNCRAGIAQSVQRLATGWTVRGSNPDGGEIFHTRPDLPWCPRNLLYNGYRVFPGGKAAGAWRWLPTTSSVEVKERVELYLCSPSGHSWSVLGWTVLYHYPPLYCTNQPFHPRPSHPATQSVSQSVFRIQCKDFQSVRHCCPPFFFLTRPTPALGSPESDAPT